MSNYCPSRVAGYYEQRAKPPFLDKVCFTLDHIKHNTAGAPSTHAVVKYLVDRGIPVTVFFACTDLANGCPDEQQAAKALYQLNPRLVSLGLHDLGAQADCNTQTANFQLISDLISAITGQQNVIMSYHGSNVAPSDCTDFDNIRYIRSTRNDSWDNGLNRLATPVIAFGTIRRNFEAVARMNQAGQIPTLFFHANELVNNSRHKRRFDNFVNSVVHRQLSAIPYLDAMELSFANAPQQPPLSKGLCRVSTFQQHTVDPQTVDYLIQDHDGQAVARTQATETKTFRLPIGDYTVTALINNEVVARQPFTLGRVGLPIHLWVAETVSD